MKKIIYVLFIFSFLLLFLAYKKPATSQKNISINDTNVVSIDSTTDSTYSFFYLKRDLLSEDKLLRKKYLYYYFNEKTSGLLLKISDDKNIQRGLLYAYSGIYLPQFMNSLRKVKVKDLEVFVLEMGFSGSTYGAVHNVFIWRSLSDYNWNFYSSDDDMEYIKDIDKDGYEEIVHYMKSAELELVIESIYDFGPGKLLQRK